MIDESFPAEHIVIGFFISLTFALLRYIFNMVLSEWLQEKYKIVYWIFYFGPLLAMFFFMIMNSFYGWDGFNGFALGLVLFIFIEMIIGILRVLMIDKDE